MAEAEKASPAFQFYPKEFLSSSKVMAMSLTERGAYITLLSVEWLDGSLPNSPGGLARILGLSEPRFRKLWGGVLSACFIERDGRLVNARLEDERRKQIAFRQRQSENGKKGGRLTQPLSQIEATGSPPLNPRVMESADSRLQSSFKEKENDVAFAEFRDAYPRSRRKGGPLVEQNFLRALDLAGGFAALMAALENHLASEQWANPRMIPGMDVWFEEERWRQELPAAAAPARKAPWPSRLAEWQQLEAARAGKAKP